MKNRALFSALTVFAIAACAGPAVSTTSSGKKVDQTCNPGGHCEVTVTVTGCVAGGTSVSSAVIAVPRGSPGHSDLTIKWSIAGNDFVFADNGIKFKTAGADREFNDPHNNGNNFTWHDLNPQGGTQGREFEYSVTVKPRQGGADCPTLDPTIVNDA